MDDAQAGFERILARFVAWAQARDDVRAAVVVGSAARQERPADPWSDLDIVILTTAPERLLAETAWLEQLGPVVLTCLENPDYESVAPGAASERRVVFEGGLDVEFAFVSAGEISQLSWALRLLHRFPGLPRLLPGGLQLGLLQQIDDFLLVARRGLRILLDKDGRLSRVKELVPATAVPPREAPTQHAFSELANDFLYHAVWTAKKLRRGELWTAKVSLDRGMKWMLLRMVEWHARSVHGAAFNTWYLGRFIEQWADPRVVQRLRAVLPGYDEAAAREALLASMGLFRDLGEETAARLGLSYPAEAHTRVEGWIRGWFSEAAPGA